MAKRKAKKSPARRRSSVRKTARRSGRRRSSGVQMSMMGAGMEIVKGIAGALIVSKVAPMIPVADNRVKYALVTAGGIFLAMKSREFRAVGLGAGIASGSLLANEFFPNLLGPGSTAAVQGVGRLSPETQRRMQNAAQEIRRGINGMRDRTVVGTGGGGNFPVPVNGPRSRTLVGSGDTSGYSY